MLWDKDRQWYMSLIDLVFTLALLGAVIYGIIDGRFIHNKVHVVEVCYGVVNSTGQHLVDLGGLI